ncbi:MAG: BON domain-containing protein, partial [Candidatus Eisenbacteria bacterium]|nr:BON domain-containing protein [Candidatus Eisenbacteria bacterium]
MGLLQFVKEAGEKLLHRPAKAETAPSAPTSTGAASAPEPDFARSLEILLGDMGFALENAEITFADGRVTVTGVADTQETREKAVLVLGNVQGVAEVDDRLEVKK